MLVAHAAHRAVAGADGQEGVAAADDGLVGVVGVEVEAAAREDARQNVPGAGDALAVFTADADCKINCSHNPIPFVVHDDVALTARNKESQKLSRRSRERRKGFYSCFCNFYCWHSRGRSAPLSCNRASRLPRRPDSAEEHGEATASGAERRGRMAGRLASAGRATRLGGRLGHARLGFRAAAPAAGARRRASLRDFLRNYQSRILLPFELPAIQAAHGHVDAPRSARTDRAGPGIGRRARSCRSFAGGQPARRPGPVAETAAIARPARRAALPPRRRERRRPMAGTRWSMA